MLNFYRLLHKTWYAFILCCLIKMKVQENDNEAKVALFLFHCTLAKIVINSVGFSVCKWFENNGIAPSLLEANKNNHNNENCLVSVCPRLFIENTTSYPFILY